MKKKFWASKGAWAVFPILVVMALFVGCSGDQEAKEDETGTTEKEANGEYAGLDSSVTLRMLESGGLSGDSIEEGYIKPFTEKTGIKVERENPKSLGKVEAAVKSGQKLYDIAELSSAEMRQAVNKGLLEELDWDKIDPEPINDEAKSPYGYGHQYYSTIMAWRESAADIETWADFWNTEKYPGKRTLPDNPVLTLPFALLADGVPLDELYPLDVDRAFKSLEKIAKHVSVWWESGFQPVELLINGEVDYAGLWSGRVAGNEDGIKYTYNQGLLDLTYFTIPKGSTDHLAEVYALIREMTKVENQAKAAEVIFYTGPNKELSSHLPQDRLDEYPTSDENYKKQALQDPEWWFEHGKEVDRRWREFKLGLGK